MILHWFKLISPGDWLSDALGLRPGEERAILRLLINTIVLGAVCLGAALMIGF